MEPIKNLRLNIQSHSIIQVYFPSSPYARWVSLPPTAANRLTYFVFPSTTAFPAAQAEGAEPPTHNLLLFPLSRQGGCAACRPEPRSPQTLPRSNSAQGTGLRPRALPQRWVGWAPVLLLPPPHPCTLTPGTPVCRKVSEPCLSAPAPATSFSFFLFFESLPPRLLGGLVPNDSTNRRNSVFLLSPGSLPTAGSLFLSRVNQPANHCLFLAPHRAMYVERV